MKNEVVVVNPQEFGIEENKANELMGNLPQIQNERTKLETPYNEVLKMDIENPETAKIARELRLKIRDNRTKGISVWHKTTKEVFLRAGQYIDAVKNREIAINERMESNLEEIEKYAENKERERIEALKQARIAELEPFSEFVPFGIDLGTLSNADYNNVLNGAKLQLQAKKDAELKAEQERIEAERLAEIERQKEIKRKEAELEAERKKAREQVEQLEAKRQAELKAEREKQAKIQAELDAEKERQAKVERERLAKLEAEKLEAEKLAKAPIKKQMEAWINLFEIPTTELNNDVVKEIQQKFDAFKDWSKKQISKI
jgi:colicin import membrane protein